MKIFHCTQKLLKKIPDSPVEVDDSVRQKTSAGLGNWYANIFLVNRKTHILFTNENTLYSFVVPNARKKVFETLQSAFLWHLRQNLEYEEIPETVISKILAEYEKVIFAKAINKSTLGMMRDITYHYQHDLSFHEVISEEWLLAINKKINGTPHKKTDYLFPIELLNKMIKNQYSH